MVTKLADCEVNVKPYYGDSYPGLRKLYFTSMANLASSTLSPPGMTLDFSLPESSQHITQIERNPMVVFW